MTSLLTHLRLLQGSLRTRGVRGTLGRAWRIVVQRSELRRKSRADEAFDRQHGVDTATWVRVPDLDTSSANVEHAVRYEPSSVSEFELLMAKLRVDHSDFTFVDYGSGKGRVLLLAAEYPFKRIVGVEFAKSLHDISQENIATLGPEAGRIETVARRRDGVRPADRPARPLLLSPVRRAGPEAGSRARPRLARSESRVPRTSCSTGPPDFAEAVEESGFERVDVDELGWMTRGVFVAPSNGRVA